MESNDDPSVIQHGAHGRLEFAKHTEATGERILRLVCLYSSRGIELAHPRHLVQDLANEFSFALPNIQFSWCLKPNLRAYFYRTSPIFRSSNLSFEALAEKCASKQCACSNLPEQFRGHESGHLHTTDTSWISNHLNLPHISSLLEQGLNHVPLAPVCFDEIMSLNCWVVETVVKAFYVPPVSVDTAVAFAVSWTLSRMPAIIESSSSSEVFDTESADFYSDVARVQQYAFVSGMDKAANHPFFICRDYALLLSAQNLQSTSSFSVVQSNPVPFVEEHVKSLLEKFLPSHLLPESSLCPILFPLFKPKKQNYRFITSTCSSAYQIAGEVCHLFAQALLRELKALCGEQNALAWSMHRIRVQMFGIIEDYRDCIINLPLSQSYSADQTADISRCFDSIPTDANHQDSLQTALKYCISAAFSFYSRRHKGKNPRFWLKICRGALVEGILSHRQIAGCVELPLQVVESLQSFLISNMYVQAGPVFARQVLGIPQGIPCGPTWANIYLFSFEYKYFKAMLRDPSTRQLLVSYPFDLWFRFIDDVKVLNNPKALDMMRDMYPTCLILESTSTCGPEPLPCSSTFLDINCAIQADGSLSFHTVFKTQTLPFQPIQYIKLRSNRPTAMCFNTLKGLSYSIASKASSPGLLFQDLLHVAKLFKKNGFPFRRTVFTILSFLDSAVVPSASVDLKQFVADFSHRFFRHGRS